MKVEKLYSKFGRKSIDLVVLIKIHILKFLFNEDSLRKTYELLRYNILYRWFIGYELCEDVPDHSTYSQNYRRKFCKLEKDLIPTGRIDKNGYIIYKSDSKDCMNCPFKEKCIKSKYKQILRYVWEEYKEMVNDYRHREDVKEIYRQRPQNIERVFADGKTKYGLRKTYFKGRKRVHRELTLLYACMNLKKFALHHYA